MFSNYRDLFLKIVILKALVLEVILDSPSMVDMALADLVLLPHTLSSTFLKTVINILKASHQSLFPYLATSTEAGYQSPAINQKPPFDHLN